MRYPVFRMWRRSKEGLVLRVGKRIIKQLNNYAVKRWNYWLLLSVECVGLISPTVSLRS